MVKPRIAIVGLGLIGGSLARRLVNAGCEVTAWNHNDRPYATAEADGIICKPTLAALAETKPNVLVLCNPLKAMPEILGALKPLIDTETTTLTDVGSVKGMVRDQVKAIGLDGCYVGAHPMAGNELSGWEASDPTLYDDALWAITVDEHTEYRRFRAVADMIVNRCGNRLIVLDDATHDRCAALISHMPHVIATAMINELVANPNRNIAAALAAGSWRDMTRVALTDPNRTRAMVEEDAANVETLLRNMANRLTLVANVLHDMADTGVRPTEGDVSSPKANRSATTRPPAGSRSTPNIARRSNCRFPKTIGSARCWNPPAEASISCDSTASVPRSRRRVPWSDD